MVQSLTLGTLALLFLLVGHYQYQFDEYHDDEEEEDEEVMTIEDDFRITAADYNHEFHNMQMPESDGKL